MNQTTREAVIEDLAFAIAALSLDRPTPVAINGRVASGKTTFASELAARLRGAG